MVAIALPSLVAASVGLTLLWRKTDFAVRMATKTEAVGLAEFIATSFGTVEETPPGTPPRVAHRAVTHAVRSNWSALKMVSNLRIVSSDGVVRWSRSIEEEDKPLSTPLPIPTALEARFSGDAQWPWSTSGAGEVALPLGGVACGGCHTGARTMQTGVLRLTIDEPGLRAQVSDVFRDALATMVIFMLALTAIVWLSVRIFLTRKLSRLASVMQKAEGGDIVVRAPPLGTDEIGRLAAAFNRMLASLTSLKASEIDTQRDLDTARKELLWKEEIEDVNSRLKTRLEELQVLYELARTIASTLDLNEVLERIAARLPTTLAVPRFSIMLLNAEGQLEVKKSFPADQQMEGVLFAVGEGVCGAAAERRKAIYVPDAEREPLFRPRDGTGALGHGSMLSVPMIHRAELLGVLNFERPEKADFSADEIEFFTAVADQAAMAVQNARLHEQTVALSMTDPLTGVPNRRHLFSQLEAELARGQRYSSPVSLLMIDIDHFKKLNDSAGHQAGDDALRAVADVLKTHIRKVDTIGRYGGEEFVIVLPQITKEHAAEVAEKLRHEVEAIAFPQRSHQPGGKLTISIGVAAYPADAKEQDVLVDCADSALYASKRAGRNKVSAFTTGMENHPDRERGPSATKTAARSAAESA